MQQCLRKESMDVSLYLCEENGNISEWGKTDFVYEIFL